MTKILWLGCLFFCALTALPSSAHARLLKDQAGRTIDAEIVGKEGAKVTIKRSDGKEFVIPVETLSQED